MSLMKIAPRTLLSNGKPASLMLTRMFDTQKKIKMGLRRRRLELMKTQSSSVPCYKALRRSENKCNQPRLKILVDECLEPCDLAPLPMDLDHYTPSDKKERKYQRTWCECYPLPKKFVSIKKGHPNRPRRNLRRNANAVECVKAEKHPSTVGRFKIEKLIDVPGTGPLPCCRIPAPGCEYGRSPPYCKMYYPPSCCKKRRTQYPSFSECKPVGLLEPIQPCECDMTTTKCDIFAYLRHLDKKR